MKSGMTFSGKELFDFNPEWAGDGEEDDGAMDASAYMRENDGESVDQLANGVDKIKVWDAPVSNGGISVALEMFEGDELEGLDDDEDDDDAN